LKNKEISKNASRVEHLSKARRVFPAHTRFSYQHLLLFGLCAALFFLSMFFRASNAIIAPQLQKDLSLTPEKLGILSASFFYAFAFTQVPIALLLDRLGARRMMSALTLAGSSGAVIFGLAADFNWAVIGRTMLGFGMAANFMGGLKLFTQWFSPGEFATISGLLAAAGTVGSIAAITPLALLVERIGWRASFVAIGVLTAALAIFFHVLVRERPCPAEGLCHEVSGASRRISVIAALKTLFFNRDYWLISCGTFFRYGTMMAIQAMWAGPYLMQCFHLSPVQAGNIITGTIIGYVAGCPGGGWLSDRVLGSRKYVVILGLAGMAATTMCLTWSLGQKNPVFQVLTFFSLGLFAGIGNVAYAHIKGVMPSEMAGMALTGINFFTMLGVGAYIHLMGRVLACLPVEKQAGLEGYETAFSPAFIGLAAATLLYFFTRESKEFSAAREKA
jgi:nitrate/nitrite transporter NarK